MSKEEMADADVEAEAMEDGEDMYDEEGLAIIKDKIVILPGAASDLSSCTFCMTDEDHTLGNALRYVIMKDPEVEFCGYSIPHPSENKVNLRIQMLQEGSSAVEALHRGLSRCDELCQVILEAYEAALVKDMPSLEMVDDEDRDPLDGVLDRLKAAKIAKGEQVDTNALNDWINLANGKTLLDHTTETVTRKRK